MKINPPVATVFDDIQVDLEYTAALLKGHASCVLADKTGMGDLLIQLGFEGTDEELGQLVSALAIVKKQSERVPRESGYVDRGSSACAQIDMTSRCPGLVSLAKGLEKHLTLCQQLSNNENELTLNEITAYQTSLKETVLDERIISDMSCLAIGLQQNYQAMSAEAKMHYLCQLVETGDLGQLQILNLTRADLVRTSPEGETLAHIAVRCGVIEVLEYLLNGEPEPSSNRGSVSGFVEVSTICDAFWRSSEESQSFVDRLNQEGVTPLELASLRGNGQAVRLMLQHCAGSNRPLGAALRHAIANQHNDVVFQLVRAGAEGALAHLAAQFGNIALLETLYAYDVSLNSLDTFELSPLHYASSYNRPDVVAYLLTKGADATLGGVPILGSPGKTWLHLAVQKNHSEVVDVVPMNYVRIDAPDRAGNTALHLAVALGGVRVIELLAEKGVNLEARNSVTMTPLHEAAHQGNLAMLKVLCRLGANLNARTDQGVTPLLAAATALSASVQGTQGSTAGSAAAKYQVLIQYLLEQAGVDVSALDGAGKSAFDYYQACFPDDSDTHFKFFAANEF